jgi:hypothetical protein
MTLVGFISLCERAAIPLTKKDARTYIAEGILREVIAARATLGLRTDIKRPRDNGRRR